MWNALTYRPTREFITKLFKQADLKHSKSEVTIDDLNHIYYKTFGIHMHDHVKIITKEATCSAEGSATYTCECGDEYTEPIPRTDHKYVNGVCVYCGAGNGSIMKITANTTIAKSRGKRFNLVDSENVSYVVTNTNEDEDLIIYDDNSIEISKDCKVNKIITINITSGTKSFTVTLRVAPDVDKNNRYFELHDVDEMICFRDIVNTKPVTDVGYNATLMNDIDMGSISNWTPIGVYSSTIMDKETGYIGIFDGNNYAIRNLTVSGWTDRYVLKAYGLFGKIGLNSVGPRSTIKNLSIYGVVQSVTAGPTNRTKGVGLGSVCGYAVNTRFENIHNHCNITKTMTNSPTCAGICPDATNCEFINCHNYGNITSYGNVGGIAGDATNVTIKNCSNHGDLYSSSYRCGGIVYRLATSGSGSIKSSYNTGTIKNVVGASGGIASISDVSVEDCVNFGDVISTNVSNSYSYLSGLIGSAGKSMTVANCINLGKVTYNLAALRYPGIFIGNPGNYGKVVNCYQRVDDEIIYGLNNISYSYDSLKDNPELLALLREDPFTEDSKNINNRYPILKYQLNLEWFKLFKEFVSNKQS